VIELNWGWAWGGNNPRIGKTSTSASWATSIVGIWRSSGSWVRLTRRRIKLNFAKLAFNDRHYTTIITSFNDRHYTTIITRRGKPWRTTSICWCVGIGSLIKASDSTWKVLKFGVGSNSTLQNWLVRWRLPLLYKHIFR
jgi:hypothetical protein